MLASEVAGGAGLEESWACKYCRGLRLHRMMPRRIELEAHFCKQQNLLLHTGIAAA